MPAASSRRQEPHDRIVRAAVRAVGERGYAGVGVADVMKEAGLTHGGFYAHLGPRTDMLARLRRNPQPDSGMSTVVFPLQTGAWFVVASNNGDILQNGNVARCRIGWTKHWARRVSALTGNVN